MMTRPSTDNVRAPRRDDARRDRGSEFRLRAKKCQRCRQNRSTHLERVKQEGRRRGDEPPPRCSRVAAAGCQVPGAAAGADLLRQPHWQRLTCHTSTRACRHLETAAACRYVRSPAAAQRVHGAVARLRWVRARRRARAPSVVRRTPPLVAGAARCGAGTASWLAPLNNSRCAVTPPRRAVRQPRCPQAAWASASWSPTALWPPWRPSHTATGRPSKLPRPTTSRQSLSGSGLEAPQWCAPALRRSARCDLRGVSAARRQCICCFLFWPIIFCPVDVNESSLPGHLPPGVVFVRPPTAQQMVVRPAATARNPLLVQQSAPPPGSIKVLPPPDAEKERVAEEVQRKVDNSG